MKAIVRLILVSILMIMACSATYSHFLRCERDDDATNEDIKAVASAWLKAARFGSPSVTC